MFVVGEQLFSAGYVARRAFQFNAVGAQVDVDVQAVFEHMEIFIAGAEQSLDVTCEFNIFFHSELCRRLQQLGPGSLVVSYDVDVSYGDVDVVYRRIRANPCQRFLHAKSWMWK